MRTGYETIVAHRVGALFAVTADYDGKITTLDHEHLVVQYKNGVSETYQIGRRFGVMAGTTMPHDMVCDLKEGASFKRGDVLAFNKQFFERDLANPTQVVYKMAGIARVALIESVDTFEDASAISPRFAKKMISDKATVRKIRVRFDQEIRGLAKIGDSVVGDTILCTIENEMGQDVADLYDEKARETLADISSMTPRAKTKGQVAMIEVLYNGELDDMSESLKKLATVSNRMISRTAELRGDPKINGRVEHGFRVDNVPIATDEAVVKVYITGKAGMGVGDKLTIANQLKSIVSQMLLHDQTSEDGQPIDMHFSYTSNYNRVVESSMVIGTSNTVLIEGAKQVLAAYRGKG